MVEDFERLAGGAGVAARRVGVLGASQAVGNRLGEETAVGPAAPSR